jgi:hypothetical protein
MSADDKSDNFDRYFSRKYLQEFKKADEDKKADGKYTKKFLIISLFPRWGGIACLI